MEFATTGAQCHHCRQRDYLPFTCKYCSNQFCLSHRTAESHECSSLAAALSDEKDSNSAPPPPANLPVKYKCHHQGCKIRELQPIHCRNCGHSHCIKHRFPTSHACEAFGSRNGVSRNTILRAGIVPPRPIDANGSTDSSTQAIAPLPATESTPRFTAAQFTSAITSFFASAASSTVATAAPAAPELTAAITSSSSVPPPIVAAVESSPLTLRNASGANSCAAEVAASAAAMSSSSVETSISSASTSVAAASSTSANINSESTSSSVPPAARRTNTNVAHLSKLLKQRS